MTRGDHNSRGMSQAPQYPNQRANANNRPEIVSHEPPTAPQATADAQLVILSEDRLNQRIRVLLRWSGRLCCSSVATAGNRLHRRFHLARLLVAELWLFLQ